MQTAQVAAQKDAIHEVIHLPFDQLCASNANVRKIPPTSIEALAMNIKAEGILQNLIVSPVTQGKNKGKYAVAGGRRRWMALGMLVQQKALPEDTPVPCKVISPEEAVTASLTENEQREPMHPADRFDAYKKLIDSGKSVEYVAALFGVTPLTVQRYLKLTNISPKLFALFRKDEITLEQMQALTLAHSHEIQEQVWFGVDHWGRQPHALKRRLTEKEVDAERHPLALFVGLEAYQAAGGAVRRDLFSSDDSGGLVDLELLRQLADEKLTAVSDQVCAEGWGWVEVVLPSADAKLYTFDRLPATTDAFTPEEAQQMQALQAEQQRLAEQMDALTDDEAEQWHVLEEQYKTIEEKLDTTHQAHMHYDTEAMKQAGVILNINYDGELVIHRGLVRRTASAAHADAGTATKPKEKPVHSEKLVRCLLAHRTAALQVELADKPEIALAVIVSHLASSIFCPFHSAQVVHIKAEAFEHILLGHADDLESSPAWKTLEALRKTWKEKLPASEDEWLNWVLEQPQATQLNLLAACVAFTVNGVQSQVSQNPMDRLAEMVGLDMTKWWTPTRVSYFDHVSKARIQQVLLEAFPKESVVNITAMKKSVAAGTAERQLAQTHWLPDLLCSHHPA